MDVVELELVHDLFMEIEKEHWLNKKQNWDLFL